MKIICCVNALLLLSIFCYSGRLFGGDAPAAAVIGPAKEIALDLGKGVKMEMVLVKAGEFDMGSNDGEANEKPVHRVKISKPFYIGKYPVTLAEWKVFVDATKYMGGGGIYGAGFEGPAGHAWAYAVNGKGAVVCDETEGIHRHNPGFKQEGNHPVVEVGWHDAEEFCKWATNATGRAVRLPTEAEWEYAARGPKSLKYPWGDKFDITLANFYDASLRPRGANMTKSGEYHAYKSGLVHILAQRESTRKAARSRWRTATPSRRRSAHSRTPVGAALTTWRAMSGNFARTTPETHRTTPTPRCHRLLIRCPRKKQVGA